MLMKIMLWIGAHRPTIWPTNAEFIISRESIRILLYISVNLSVFIRRFILWRATDEKEFFSMLKECPRFFEL